MKPSSAASTLAILAASNSVAQKLETQTPDPKKAVRVETARDHLTVIELNEPVSMVAVGNQNVFTVERHEIWVFIRPADEDARTNLFIWTASGRYSHELAPAPSQRPLLLVSANAPSNDPAPRNPTTQLPVFRPQDRYYRRFTGRQASGWIGFLPASSMAGQHLLRFGVAPDVSTAVDAYLVLGKVDGTREVALGRPAGE